MLLLLRILRAVTRRSTLRLFCIADRYQVSGVQYTVQTRGMSGGLYWYALTVPPYSETRYQRSKGQYVWNNFYWCTWTVVYRGCERFTGKFCSEFGRVFFARARVDSPVPTQCIGVYYTYTWSYMLGLSILLQGLIAGGGLRYEYYYNTIQRQQYSSSSEAFYLEYVQSQTKHPYQARPLSVSDVSRSFHG